MLVQMSARRMRREWVAAVSAAVVVLWASSAAAQLAGDRPVSVDAPVHVIRDAEGNVRFASGMAIATEGTGPRERVASFLRVHGAAFDLDDLDLDLDDVRAVKGLTIAVLRRRVSGERVFRRSVRLRFDAAGRVDLLVSDPGSRHVSGRARRITDARVAGLAETLVRFDHPRAFVQRRWIEVGGVLVRGFVVEVDGARRIERAQLVFDGGGQLVAGGPRTTHALGRVYLPNPVVAMDETSDVELPNLTSVERLTGRFIRVSSCSAEEGCDAPLQRARADGSGDFLYDPSDPDYDDEFSEVSAYYHSDLIAAYFRETHEFIWDCCDSSTVLNVVANYTEAPGRPYDNAAYSPSSCSRSECGTIVLGQGPLRDYSYDGDVVYHEYTHAVVDTLANIAGFDFDDLGISYEPGAINEGTADYFSATLAGDPTVAEYFSGSGSLGTSGALRHLDNDFRCPDDLFGEGHRDGRLWGGAGWAVREALGADKADALMYGTLAMMVDNTDFDEAGRLLVATAEAFESDGTFTAEDVSAVSAEVADRGLAGCRRIVPLDDGEEHLGYSGIGFATGTIGGLVAPTHYSIEIPADATKLTLDVVPATASGEHTIFLRDGESLRFVGSDLRYDGEVEVDREERSVELGPADPHPLPLCETLYIAVRTDDLNDAGESVYSIRATLERSGDPEAACPDPPAPDGGADAEIDGGGDDAGDDGGDGGPPTELDLGGGGCRCNATSRPPGSLPVSAVFALHLLRRRRKRSAARSAA
jgi:hypothetical protein